MPSIGEIPHAKVRIMCEELERLLKPPILKDEERAKLHASDVDLEERTKDDWWKRLAEVRSYARRKEGLRKKGKARPTGPVDETAILEAIREEPEEVTLPDGTLVFVHPASFERIMVVEDLYFWTLQLIAWRAVIKKDPENFENADELLERLRAECNLTRARLYAQVGAPGPEPLPLDKDPPNWAHRVTVLGELALLNAWIEVNSNRVKRAEEAIRERFPIEEEDKKGEQPTPGSLQGFPVMMASVAFREKKAPTYVMRDRSLAEVFVTYTAHNRQSQFEREVAREQAERDAKERGRK